MTDPKKHDLQTAMEMDRRETEARIAFERVAKLMAELARQTHRAMIAAFYGETP